MKQDKKRKLVLKKATVVQLSRVDKVVIVGGSLRMCSASGCPGTFACCQQTK